MDSQTTLSAAYPVGAVSLPLMHSCNCTDVKRGYMVAEWQEAAGESVGVAD